MTWWHYLLLVNFYLVLFFGFYALLLRRETFFQLNRIYLVAASLLSFLIPLIQSDWVKSLFITQQVQHTIYSYSGTVMVYNFTPAQSGFTIGEILNIFYIVVTLFLALRLVWQLVILKKAIEKPTPSVAYSFFKKISLGDNLANTAVINAHEEVHARQWHSVDVLIIETVMIINWFNPVVYLYRFAIKYIHEFIADKQVLDSGTDKADYALLLLSQTFNTPAHYLSNPFYNNSLLKKRIQMLQKNKSHRIALVKYGLSAPLFILMMILSSATINNSKAVVRLNKKAEKVFLLNAVDVVKDITDNTPIPAQLIAKAERNIKVAISDLNLNLAEDAESIQSLQQVKPEDSPENNVIYTGVEKNPEPVGGYDQLYRFIGQNVRYPKEMKEKNIQGKAFVQFIVEKDGSLTNIQSVRSPGYGSGEEVERVLALAPKWIPGSQNGKAVRSQYTIPVSFTLGQDLDETLAPPNMPGKVYTGIEKNPEPLGGIAKFYRFLADNIRYPREMYDNKTEGRVVVSFVVEKDGSLSTIKAINGVTDAAKNEAERVMALSPKWIPAYQDGKAVGAQYIIPVNFSLGNSMPAPARITVIDTVRVIKYGNVAPVKTISQADVVKLSNQMPAPVFIIDGVIKDKNMFTSLDASGIESFSVLRNPGTVLDQSAPNGIIIVTTKAYKALSDETKKLPGISVDSNGKIMAQGNAVSKVLLDGKEVRITDITNNKIKK